MHENFLNKKVIIRGDRSGVFFGTLTAKNGKNVEDCGTGMEQRQFHRLPRKA